MDAALDWTYQKVRLLRATDSAFERDLGGVESGELASRSKPGGSAPHGGEQTAV